MNKSIVFMGVCGCGKSTVAKLFFDKTGMNFLEGDLFHPPENIQKMTSGIPLTDEDRSGWLTAISVSTYSYFYIYKILNSIPLSKGKTS